MKRVYCLDLSPYLRFYDQNFVCISCFRDILKFLNLKMTNSNILEFECATLLTLIHVNTLLEIEVFGAVNINFPCSTSDLENVFIS
jgi:hypothetical protein